MRIINICDLHPRPERQLSLDVGVDKFDISSTTVEHIQGYLRQPPLAGSTLLFLVMHSVLGFAPRSRLALLPAHFNQLLFVRLASTSTSASDTLAGDLSASTADYPFPKHAHPTPYEIFHLRPGAPPGAIKSRCSSQTHRLYR